MKSKIWLLALVVCSVGMADNTDIEACLRAWGKHPFGKNPNYRTLKSGVKVVGIGANTKDVAITEKPELVLVKASVSVMSGQSFELMNPNGWYCIKGPVTVMGKAKITAHCKAQLANSDDGVAVLGSSDNQTGGVAVLGKIQVERTCQ
jgi:hypothetical protein